MSKIFIMFIRAYQLTLSPLFAALGTGCRFHPSCSEYAIQSFRTLPWFKALYLSSIRVLKCGPWHAGGIDPVRQA